jgi:hypothetical protein
MLELRVGGADDLDASNRLNPDDAESGILRTTSRTFTPAFATGPVKGLRKSRRNAIGGIPSGFLQSKHRAVRGPAPDDPWAPIRFHPLVPRDPD